MSRYLYEHQQYLQKWTGVTWHSEVLGSQSCFSVYSWYSGYYAWKTFNSGNPNSRKYCTLSSEVKYSYFSTSYLQSMISLSNDCIKFQCLSHHIRSATFWLNTLGRGKGYIIYKRHLYAVLSLHLCSVSAIAIHKLFPTWNSRFKCIQLFRQQLAKNSVFQTYCSINTLVSFHLSPEFILTFANQTISNTRITLLFSCPNRKENHFHSQQLILQKFVWCITDSICIGRKAHTKYPIIIR